ncbi:hypothetical protein SO802_013564 [Lithocarpus litseifolius]|uniref:Leucine-rich repeat-containing N-terminal plant-type domain-containing protein n=1 Tax=Lithocarpus litseifolius TaxID=425828 RepID=A0AAW2D5Y2_9ROSI
MLHATDCFASRQRVLCHDDESSALLQFKEIFHLNKSDCIDSSAYPPKISSWKEEGVDRDCCSWDGVECNEETGHVIGLDLSSSCLYGSMVSNSSLVHLVHLQGLNLAHNNFNISQIPSGFGHLSRLTYLNLSNSSFSGQIPSKFSELSKLTSLNLSYNSMLHLRSLKGLVQNLTSLEDLSLRYVQIPSPVPEILANLSSLRTLHLTGCGMYGEFPVGIFKLLKLQDLRVGYNQVLMGNLPEFYSSSPLKILSLWGTSFSGKLPDSIGNLNSLNVLLIGNCDFSGHIPSSLGNLTRLTYLDLSNNSFVGQIPSSLSNLISLSYLNFSLCQFSGSIPASFGNLTQLTYLILYQSFIRSSNPSSLSWLGKLSKLTLLNLQGINLTMEIPSSFANLTQLSYLVMTGTQLMGRIPSWLANLTQLTALELPFYKLQGSIPISIFELKKLEKLNLYSNYLSGTILDLRSNMLQALPLIPPPSTLVYLVADNMLQGEVLPLICKLSSLHSLDLANNKFRGTLPHCLSNFSNALSILNLQGNNFHGMIPQLCAKGSRMKMIDLSQNQFEGLIPRSLSNCKMLEILNLGSNQLNDVFPSWLGTLSELRVLILRRNGLYGIVGSPTTIFAFPKLHILDLSSNKFTAIDLSSNEFNGKVSEFIGNLNGLQLLNLSNNNLTGHIPLSLGDLTTLESLDFSQNKFSGRIPWQLTQLTFLASFNVSHNQLTGLIPHGNQFDTFENSSFAGNLGLCGNPLSKKCENHKQAPLPSSGIKEVQDSWFHIEFDWKIILPGYVSGLIIGVVVGNVVTEKMQCWFVRTRRRQLKR